MHNKKSLSFCWLTFLLTAIGAHAQEAVVVRRLTHTPAQSINLHPFLSSDGRRVAFESSADLLQENAPGGLQTFVAGVDDGQISFSKIANSRATRIALSHNGQQAVLASKDNPLGTNLDGNSEIFYFDGTTLHQLTITQPNAPATRVDDGNFGPSLSDDATLAVFTSNRDLVPGKNLDASDEVFLYQTAHRKFVQLTNFSSSTRCERAQLSGDGRWVSYLLTEVAQEDTSSTRQLMLHNVSSGEVTMVRAGVSLMLAETRVLSDDAARLVFSASDEKGVAQVYLYDHARQKIKQLAQIAKRSADVALQPTISGDGRRIAFATKRRVNDFKSAGGVEVYVYDVPAGELLKITDAPSDAEAEVSVSLNDDGTKAAFNFPRLWSEPTLPPEFKDAQEIYLVEVPPSKRFMDDLSILNAASLLAAPERHLAPGVMAVARGVKLAEESIYAERQADGEFGFSLAGTVVFVNNHPAPIYYVSPTQVSFRFPVDAAPGACTVTVINSDGFENRSACQIEPTSPGIFTVNGEGTGAAAILEDGLRTSAGNSWSQRITLFGTGFDTGKHVALVISGKEYIAEAAVHAVENLKGLHQITFDVPQVLRGAGEVTVYVKAGNRASNEVRLNIDAAVRGEVVINEILYDPPDGPAGDANGDGQRSGSADEFIEVSNASPANLLVANWSIATKTSAEGRERTVHRFPAGAELPPGAAAVVFGGGDLQHPSLFGNAQIFKASAGGLSLNNTSMIVVVRDATGTIVAESTYGPDQAQAVNQSLTRSPEIIGSFVPHSSAGDRSRLFSPGTSADGVPHSSPSLSRIEIVPRTTTTIEAGTPVELTAKAFGIVNNREMEIPFVKFAWEAGGASPQILSSAHGQAVIVNALRAGTITVRARAGGHEAQTQIVVNPLVSTIELTPETVNFSVGQKINFKATARDAAGELVSDLTFEFVLADANAANVVILEKIERHQALVRGDNAGTVWLIASYVNAVSGKVVMGRAKLVVEPAPVIAKPMPGELIINEVVTAFARSTTQERQDFVELFNQTNSPLDITGLRVLFRPTGAAVAASTFMIHGATVIQPRSYFLIANGAQTFGVQADADASAAGFDLNNTSGGIRIILDGVSLDGLTYQGSNNAEPPTLFKTFGEGVVFKFTGGATNNLLRVPDARDTNDNAADFRRNGTASAVSPKRANPNEP